MPFFPSKQISPSIIEETNFVRWLAVALLLRTAVEIAFDGSLSTSIGEGALANVTRFVIDLLLSIAAIVTTISALIHSYKSGRIVWFVGTLIFGPITAIIYAFVLGGFYPDTTDG
jgi:hypothetical protein